MNDINFSMQSTDQNPSVACKAILLYASHDRFQQKMTFATMHEVANVGTTARPNFQVLPGSPVSTESLVGTLGNLAKQYVLNAELLSENVLSFSPLHLMWWSPATTRRVFFNNKELGKRSAVVPHPPLLHLVIRKTWFIFALKEDKRPTKETEVFHAPYFNVYDDGKICIGSAAIPDQLTSTLINQWEDAFFDSAFTHPNGQIKKSLHPRGEYALWKELLDGKNDSYPLEFLVPLKATVGKVLKAASKSIGAQNG